MKTNEMAIVMLKFCQGEDVQRRAKDVFSDWEDVKNPLWNWDIFEYRVKPKEEKPKRMTNMQLAEWCAKGNGTWSHEPSKFRSRYHYFWFSERAENEEVCPSIWVSLHWKKLTILMKNKAGVNPLPSLFKNNHNNSYKPKCQR